MYLLINNIFQIKHLIMNFKNNKYTKILMKIIILILFNKINLINKKLKMIIYLFNFLIIIFRQITIINNKIKLINKIVCKIILLCNKINNKFKIN